MVQFLEKKEIKKRGKRIIFLDDTATFICNRKIKIPLSELYFFKYGDLYYRKRYGFDFYNEDPHELQNIQTQWSIIRKKYWKHRKEVDETFIEKFKDYVESNNIDEEWNQIFQLLLELKDVSIFLKTYAFHTCNHFSKFLDFLKYYYRIGSELNQFTKLFMKENNP
jgi:hypothetical protein